MSFHARTRVIQPIGIKLPLSCAAFGEARKTKSCAIESGLTHWEISASGMLLRLAGVSIVVGSTPLTVTPVPAISRAMVRINVASPDFETMYAAAPGNG